MHHLKNLKITTKCYDGGIGSMAVSHIEFYSEKLEMKTRVNVILPEHFDKDGQVLLLDVYKRQRYKYMNVVPFFLFVFYGQ